MRVKYVMRTVECEREKEFRYHPGQFHTVHVLKCGHESWVRDPISTAEAIDRITWPDRIEMGTLKRRCYKCADAEPVQ